MPSDIERIEKAGRKKLITDIIKMSDGILKRVSPSRRGVTNKKGMRSYLDRTLSTEDLLMAQKDMSEEVNG